MEKKEKNIEELLKQEDINIKADAKTVIEACKDKGLNSVPKCSLVEISQTPPPNQLLKEQLYPTIPVIHLRHKIEAFEPWVQESCQNYPIVLIKKLLPLLNFDVTPFSSQNLAKLFPKVRVEIRIQMQQASEENWDTTYSKKIWNCYSVQNYTTMKKYANYQATKFIEHWDEVFKYIADNPNDMRNMFEISETIEKHKKGQIRFGTNIDLPQKNMEKWKPLLQELKKLPPFLQVDSDNSMLSYVNHTILGVNSVQLYMKIPGCRITGHQENNNFCSVNINLGPGECEWFAVSNEYWHVIRLLCEHNGVDYMRDSWWPPSLDELYEQNVPVYRFRQKCGDVVWINVGCIQWMYSVNFCNNIAWNVGPFTARQYQLAIERYEWNKRQSFQSIVPMVHLSWNLARNTKISDPQLYRMIKDCMLRTLSHCYLILEFVKNKDVKIKPYKEKEMIHYCSKCQIELFNILLLQEKKKMFVPLCLDCALKHYSPLLKGFICIEKYDMQDLMNVYDNFTLDLSMSILPSNHPLAPILSSVWKRYQSFYS